MIRLLFSIIHILTYILLLIILINYKTFKYNCKFSNKSINIHWFLREVIYAISTFQYTYIYIYIYCISQRDTYNICVFLLGHMLSIFRFYMHKYYFWGNKESGKGKVNLPNTLFYLIVCCNSKWNQNSSTTWNVYSLFYGFWAHFRNAIMVLLFSPYAFLISFNLQFLTIVNWVTLLIAFVKTSFLHFVILPLKVINFI